MGMLRHPFVWQPKMASRHLHLIGTLLGLIAISTPFPALSDDDDDDDVDDTIVVIGNPWRRLEVESPVAPQVRQRPSHRKP